MTNIIAIGLRRAPVPALTNCIIECCYWAEAAGGCAGATGEVKQKEELS